MDAKEFLRGKGVLGTDKTEFIIRREDGTIFDFVKLLDEFKSLKEIRSQVSDSLKGCPFHYCDSDPKCNVNCRYNGIAG